MGQIIKVKPPIAAQSTHRYKFKGKTYIVQSSLWLPDKGDDKPYGLRDRVEYILANERQLTGISAEDTISSSVDVLSARKEQ